MSWHHHVSVMSSNNGLATKIMCWYYSWCIALNEQNPWIFHTDTFTMFMMEGPLFCLQCSRLTMNYEFFHHWWGDSPMPCVIVVTTMKCRYTGNCIIRVQYIFIFNKNTLETCKNPRPTSHWSELTVLHNINYEFPHDIFFMNSTKQCQVKAIL